MAVWKHNTTCSSAAEPLHRDRVLKQVNTSIASEELSQCRHNGGNVGRE